MTDTAERSTAERARGAPALGVWAVLVLVLAAVGAVILIERDVHEVSAADRGSLTSAEYLTAASVARTQITEQHATVTRAVATLVRRAPTGTSGCSSGPMLVVHLMGDFPDIRVGPGSGPAGPDRWVTVKADAATGQECGSGPHVGHFPSRPGYADLMPAL